MRPTLRLTATAAALTLTAAGLIAVTGGTATATAASVCSQSYLPLPDATCQPGALNPAVTQATIHSRICVGGYSTSIRPPTSYTNALKVKQIAEYGYADNSTADYEEDHLINLSLGGDPRSPQNLWPEPRYQAGGSTAGDKDTVEFKLYKAVCAGTIQLAPAQQAIATDWTTALAAVGIG
ncbi:hypothetical protein QMK19_08950 [Streptomyces sp. H10-C2]|uniref:hypothetical protein n=1 Tax=unclassified Streptomyces TaxID=2593676 RepID=UPI0024BBE842|nr:MULTISPECIES: hypothetical protein [unclassified Streptomyces]MDJ0340966.1 hypothetical protein [Streptomyces sp. PH10-H1]MDJ0369802.1 hypothetical protein [Streptomyces sp. H10-C2]